MASAMDLPDSRRENNKNWGGINAKVFEKCLSLTNSKPMERERALISEMKQGSLVAIPMESRELSGNTLKILHSEKLEDL